MQLLSSPANHWRQVTRCSLCTSDNVLEPFEHSWGPSADGVHSQNAKGIEVRGEQRKCPPPQLNMGAGGAMYAVSVYRFQVILFHIILTCFQRCFAELRESHCSLLTGDKLETATCIAKSSRLVSRTQAISLDLFYIHSFCHLF